MIMTSGLRTDCKIRDREVLTMKRYQLVRAWTNGTVGICDVLSRYRRDAVIFQLHRMVYDAAESQGLRDTRAAWNALREAYDMRPMIHVGDQLITWRIVT